MDKMKKGDNPKRKKLLFIVITTAVAFILFIGIVSYYIKNFENALIEESSRNLSEITGHIATNLNNEISNVQKTMESIGLTISSTQRDFQNKMFLNSLCKKNELEYMGIALANGELIATKEMKEKDISRKDYFQRSMNGESVLEYVPAQIFKDKVISGLLISVPIYDLGKDPEKPISVLVAMLDMDKFVDNVQIASFNGQGSTFIIDSKWNVVYQTKSMNYSNLYLILQNNEFNRGYNLQAIQEDLQENKAGFSTYSEFGVEKFLHYRDLGIADWSVVSIIEKNIITAKTTRLTQQLIVMAIIVMVLFPVLLIFAILSLVTSKTNKLAVEAKSAFLANMSHEIRTPMNAIVGIGEILLREEISDSQRNYVLGIVNAGNGLLAIINDILDVSKIESGKFGIIEEEYELESLVYDIVAIIAVKLNDKPIEFLVDLDPELPRYLVGDMIRVKQVLINIIGNAAKFTQMGYIKLGIYGSVENGQIMLNIPVEDTGIGIQKNELEKLFDSFSQVDTHKNHSVEGTGLGLVISKRLCEMMGGGISVESTYEKGSVFTVQINQKVVRTEKMMQVPNPETFRLLILETSFVMQEHYGICMDRMHITYEFCGEFNGFLSKAKEGTYTHVMASPVELKYLAEKAGSLQNTITVALLNLKENSSIKDIGNTIITSLFTMQLAAILCGRHEKSYLTKRGGIDLLTIQPMPFVHVLIVDDNEVNLQVANGLMAPYHMNVDCAQSGKQAISMLKKQDYDLVFMDHMMPEMDGVEAVKIIRLLEGDKGRVPVIALTANVTQDAKGLFMKSGFNDFLSKPIDTIKLGGILKKWLKDINDAKEIEDPVKAEELRKDIKKKEHHSLMKKVGEQFKNAAYIDFSAGVDNLGSCEAYSKVLATYKRTAVEKLKDFPKLLDENPEQFTIEIHGLKGASGGIHAMFIAEAAAGLERLAKENKVKKIREELPEFLSALESTLVEIDGFITQYNNSLVKTEKNGLEVKGGKLLQSQLNEFKEAFWIFDSDKLKELFEYHSSFSYGEKEQELLDKLISCYDTYEFDTPVCLIEDYEDGLREEGLLK